MQFSRLKEIKLPWYVFFGMGIEFKVVTKQNTIL